MKMDQTGVVKHRGCRNKHWYIEEPEQNKSRSSEDPGEIIYLKSEKLKKMGLKRFRDTETRVEIIRRSMN